MQKRVLTMRNFRLSGIVLGALAMVAFVVPAQATEWKTVEVKKYGYSFKIPAQFERSGDEDKTTSWLFQPGSAPKAGDSSSKSTKKKRKFGVNIKGVGFSQENSEENSSSGSGSGGGGLEPALQVYVNWVWMPDVGAGTLYKANWDSVKKDMSSPDPNYTAATNFDKKQGYAYEGNTFWYKEVDKKKGDEIHRWHIYSAGNKSAYTIGLTGTFEQFIEWGPLFEEVVKSFKLIPLEK